MEAVGSGRDVSGLPGWATSALTSIGGYNAVWETYRRAPQDLLKLRQTFFLSCRNHHELHRRAQATGTEGSTR